MTCSVKAGRLLRDGKPVPYRASPNIGGTLKPEYLVMHYTADDRAAGAIAWLCDPRAKASAHLVIDQAGAVTQLVPLDRVAWHAGVSKWAGRSGCNNFTIGVELVNAGPLNKRGDGKYATALGGTVVPASSVVIAAHKNGGPERAWQTYPPAQIAAAMEIAGALVAAYGLRDVIGHEDIAPARKADPGPAFPMASFRARVIGRAADKAPPAKAGKAG